MKTYRVPCSWEMTGAYYIEAENEDEALKKVEESPDFPDPGCSSFVDGSFETEYPEEVEDDGQGRSDQADS